MALSTPGPRALLKRLREVMAEPLEPQQRLDKIVKNIAANMVAEVCSVYLLRADSMLELFATEGLNPSAVHQTSLPIGQGLVGLIAATTRPLNLPDAQSHPSFAYLPETGEEIFKSFLGVPILRGGRMLGVLVVQNQNSRTYNDMEIEALETTAMVLAELIIAGNLHDMANEGMALDLSNPHTVRGLSLSDGLAYGHVVLHEPRVVVTNLFNESADIEHQKLHDALGELRISIDDMLARGDLAKEGDHRDILEAYRMFANDRGWVRRMEEAIQNGLTAEAAVEKVQGDNRARMMRINDPYLRERLHDFDDLAHRLLRKLMNENPIRDGLQLPERAVVLARHMGAAELLDYPREHLIGLVLEDAGPTSHVVIVARALGIPVVTQVVGVVSMAENNDPVIVDGEEGSVLVRPAQDMVHVYKEKIEFRAKRFAQYSKLAQRPAISKDGIEISLNMNAGLLVDLPQLEASNADGISLFRTELQFMVAARFPRPSEQELLYKEVMESVGDKPVTFRTLDVGGDKILPYLRLTAEENPALGWRAIRLALDRPGLLRTQIRALLKAAGNRKLRLMVPMITDVSEMHEVRSLLDHERSLMAKFGHAMPSHIELGAMIEVPSLLFQLDELMQVADFVSIGSNDLFQFMFASDRGNSKVANRYDPLSHAFLRALKNIVDAGNRHDTPVTLCGEIAGRPLSAMALMGLGFRSFSMSPASIGPVKAMLLGLDVKSLQDKFLSMLDASIADGQTIRELLIDFAETNGIPY